MQPPEKCLLRHAHGLKLCRTVQLVDLYAWTLGYVNVATCAECYVFEVINVVLSTQN